MIDIVERLRDAVDPNAATPIGEVWNLAEEAADEIERLRIERSSLISMMAKAHAVMRETGWHQATDYADKSSDGILELAAEEMESEFAMVLK